MVLKHVFKSTDLSPKLQGTFCSVPALEAFSVLLCCLHSIKAEGGKEGGREGETSRSWGQGVGCGGVSFVPVSPMKAV